MNSKTLILSLKAIIALNFSLKVFAGPDAVKRAEEVEKEFIPYAISSVMNKCKNKEINTRLFKRLEECERGYNAYMITMLSKQMQRSPKDMQNQMKLQTDNRYIYEEETESYCNYIYKELGNDIKKSKHQDIIKECIIPYCIFYFFKHAELDQQDFKKLIEVQQSVCTISQQDLMYVLEDAYDKKILPIFRYAIIEQLKAFNKKEKLNFAYPCKEDLFLQYDLFAMELALNLNDLLFGVFCKFYQGNLNYCPFVIWEKFLATYSLSINRKLKEGLKEIRQNRSEALECFESTDTPSILDALFYDCKLPYDPFIYLNHLLPSFKASEALKKSIENTIAELEIKEKQLVQENEKQKGKIARLKDLLIKHLVCVNQEIEKLKREQQEKEQQEIDAQMRKEKMMQMKQQKQTKSPITKEKLDEKFGPEKASVKSKVFVEKEITLEEIQEMQGGTVSKKGSHSALHTDEGVIMFHQTHGRDTKNGKSDKITIRTIEKNDDEEEK